MVQKICILPYIFETEEVALVFEAERVAENMEGLDGAAAILDEKVRNCSK